MLLTSPCFLKGRLITALNTVSPNVSLGSKPGGSSGGASKLLTDYRGHAIQAAVAEGVVFRTDLKALPLFYPLTHQRWTSHLRISKKNLWHRSSCKYFSAYHQIRRALCSRTHALNPATKIRTKHASLDFSGGRPLAVCPRGFSAGGMRYACE